MEGKYELVKFSSEGIELVVNVDPKEETIWLSLEDLSKLFNRDKSVISKHIKNVLVLDELNESSCVAFFATELNKYDPRTGKYRKTKVRIKKYNLDMIISIGYRVNSVMGIKFRKWATSVLREYLLKGYVINEERVTVSNENYIELRNEVSSINNRLIKLEDKVFSEEYKIDKIFYNGSFYDSYTLIQSIFESANNSIIIIDNYIDRSVLDRLVVKKKEVKVIIYTNNKTSKLIDSDIDKYKKEYGLIEIINSNKVHDRYIIIDNKKLYHLGASIKDLGKKVFSITELNDLHISELLRNI